MQSLRRSSRSTVSSIATTSHELRAQFSSLTLKSFTAVRDEQATKMSTKIKTSKQLYSTKTRTKNHYNHQMQNHNSRRGYAASSSETSEILTNTTSSAAAASASSSAEIFVLNINDVVQTALEQVQTNSGLPWWATLGATACFIRISMLPIVSKQMKASVLIAHASSILQQKNLIKQKTKTSFGNDISETLRIASELRNRLPDSSKAAHPYWIIAAPMIQLPTFICAISGVRSLISKASNDVASGHQSALYAELSNGGMLWFRDLTLSGLDLTNLYAPMGIYGVILPSLTAAMVFANIDKNFTKIASENPRSIHASIKLLLEWMCVPILIAGMQLPQAVHCYWLAGSTYSYVQSTIIQSEAGKKSKLLGTSELEYELKRLSQRGVDKVIAFNINGDFDSNNDNNNNNNNGIDSFHAASIVDSPSPSLTEDLEKGLKRAAEFKAKGKNIEACKELEKLLQIVGDDNNVSNSPQLPRIDITQGHPSVWYALAQTRASMKNWKHAASAYEASARLETDAAKRGKALFGAGISRGKLNEVSKSIDALQEAHNLLPADMSILIALASSFKMSNDIKKAIEILRKLAPQHPEVQTKYIDPLEREMKEVNSNVNSSSTSK